MMKKIFAGILSGILALCLAGCSNAQQAASQASSAAAPQAASSEAAPSQASSAAEQATAKSYRWPAPIEGLDWGMNENQVMEGLSKLKAADAQRKKEGKQLVLTLTNKMQLFGADATVRLTLQENFGLMGVSLQFEPAAIENVNKQLEQQYGEPSSMSGGPFSDNLQYFWAGTGLKAFDKATQDKFWSAFAKAGNASSVPDTYLQMPLQMTSVRFNCGTKGPGQQGQCTFDGTYAAVLAHIDA